MIGIHSWLIISKTVSFYLLCREVVGIVNSFPDSKRSFIFDKIKKNPNLIAQEETKRVTDSIRKYMELPTDEEPTLATITDQEKLKEQDFFKNAQNGDKVLIYTKAKKAILYRPSTGRVVEFAPLVLGTKSVTIAIYNGTVTVGLTAEYEKKLAGIEDLSVVSKSNAAKSDYSKTLIVDVNGNHKDIANQISQLVGGEVVDKIPDGETTPQADILIIAGR